MQVAVLFTVRLLWGNGIELLSCQSPVLLLLDWLLRLYTSTLKLQHLGNQPEESASNTATQSHFSHGHALWRERKHSAGQRDEHLITMLLSPHTFNPWLPHWFKCCGSLRFPQESWCWPCPAKAISWLTWEQATCPEQSSAQGPRAPPVTDTKSGTTPVPQEPRTLVPCNPVLVLSKWAFLPTRALKAFLSHLLRRRFTMAPRATFPSCFLTTPAERGIYLQRQWRCALYCPLDFESPPTAQALTNSCP